MSDATSGPLVSLEIDHSEPHWSISQVQMFQRCPKQWKFRYVDGLKRPPNKAMATGTGIHEGLEFNSKVKIETGEDANMTELLDVTAQKHDEAFIEVEDALPGEADKLKDENVEIARFYRRVQAPHIQPLQAEQSFTLVVPSDDRGDYLPVIGYIDSSAMVPDTRPGPTVGRPVKALEDYKRPVRNKKTQADVDVSLQLSLYDYVQSFLPEPLPTVIGLRNLGFNGPKSRAADGPGPYTSPVYRTQAMMEPQARAMRHQRSMETVRQVQLLSQTGLFPPTDDMRVCSWCGYKDICQEQPR